jgi:ankyrin repeat protein
MIYLLVFQLLLLRGAEVNKRPDGGATPLHIAAQQGHIEVAKELIEYVESFQPFVIGLTSFLPYLQQRS